MSDFLGSLVWESQKWTILYVKGMDCYNDEGNSLFGSISGISELSYEIGNNSITYL
jgi:hypothetical protein